MKPTSSRSIAKKTSKTARGKTSRTKPARAAFVFRDFVRQLEKLDAQRMAARAGARG